MTRTDTFPQVKCICKSQESSKSCICTLKVVKEAMGIQEIAEMIINHFLNNLDYKSKIWDRSVVG